MHKWFYLQLKTRRQMHDKISLKTKRYSMV